MDTPALVYNLIYRAPGHNAMRRAILGFCGFDMAKTLSFGPVKDSDAAQRQQWLNEVRQEGLKLSNGALSPWNRFINKTLVWLQAIRLQFYPMTCLAYATGAFAAGLMGYGFQLSLFWIGYLWLFLLEMATVLSNDYLDLKSDEQNKFFSPFTGGSRVLVDKLLSQKEIRNGIFITLGLSFVVLAYVLTRVSAPMPQVLATCAVLFVLAMGYTVPPLRLSYRGLGEITVGLTHSFLVVLCGYLFQGGPLTDAAPWLLSLPMFFAVLPSIILSGSPDYEADKAAGKKTLAVRFGKKGAARLALIFTWVAALIVVVFTFTDPVPPTFHYLIIPVLAHAIYLTYRLYRYLQNPNPASRIDSLMVAALTYLIWFALIPLINLW
jgi:1,4-dihydroxy-2-naphthoate polyprenyltransferase